MPPDAPAIASALHRALRPLQAEPLWTCARRILAGRPARVWSVASLVASVDATTPDEVKWPILRRAVALAKRLP